MSAPDIPAPAERQDSKLPDKPVGNSNGMLSRRRGYAALIKGATGGDLKPVASTGQAPPAQKLGA